MDSGRKNKKRRGEVIVEESLILSLEASSLNKSSSEHGCNK
jgi:hypothetical protein